MAQMVLGPCRCVGCGQNVGYKRLFDGSLLLVTTHGGNHHVCRHARQEEAFPSSSFDCATQTISDTNDPAPTPAPSTSR